MAVTLRWRKLKSGTLTAILDINHNGTRNYETLKIYISKRDSSDVKKEKKQTAEAIKAKRVLEIAANDYEYQPNYKRKADFAAYFKKYKDNYKNADYRKVDACYKHFQNFINKDKPESKNKSISFKSIKPKFCKDFLQYITDNLKSSSSVIAYWKKFKAVLKQAVIEEIIPKNPAQNITIKNKGNENKVDKEVLTIEELQILAKTYCGNEDVKNAFLFACFSGLGMAEIKVLIWQDVKNERIKVLRQKTKKSSKSHIDIKLSPTALSILSKYNKDKSTALVFPSFPSDTAINKNLRNWVKRAKIDKHITFYCARHTFAVTQLINGANLKTVSDNMGHSSMEQTVKYLNYIDELKDKAIDNLPNLDF